VRANARASNAEEAAAPTERHKASVVRVHDRSSACAAAFRPSSGTATGSCAKSRRTISDEVDAFARLVTGDAASSPPRTSAPYESDGEVRHLAFFSSAARSTIGRVANPSASARTSSLGRVPYRARALSRTDALRDAGCHPDERGDEGSTVPRIDRSLRSG
jgi:hypothetical protein